MTKLQALQEKYFDKLEENGVDFINFEDKCQGYSETHVKDEYDVSVREMCEYLNMPEWLIEWAVEMIEEEKEEIKNKRKFYKEFNKKVEKRAKEVRFLLEQKGLALNYN